MSRELPKAALRAQVGDEVRAFQAAVDAMDEAVAGHLGVNRTDLRCLDVLMQVGSATPGQLATELGLTTGSVTAMLDRLARLGYLTRRPDPGDRRKVTVVPTPEAQRRAGALYGPLAEQGDRELSRYTQAELEVIIDYLRRSRHLQDEHTRRVREMGR
jgi:DNA-binding MarR family transcriptional regulator